MTSSVGSTPSFSQGAVTFAGVSSGLDTTSIINELMSIEQQPVTQMQWQSDLWTERKSDWSQLSTLMNNLSTASSTLLDPDTWAASTGVTSSDPTAVTGTDVAGQTPAAGSYTVTVGNLATGDTWSAANNLPTATAGSRQTGIWYSAGAPATASTQLRQLTNSAGTSLGLSNGSQLTVNYAIDGVSHADTLAVTATTTLGDLTSWLQTQLPAGSTVTLGSDGTITVQGAPGTASEVTSLSMTAVNKNGALIKKFNGSPGAESSTVTHASDGGATANDTLAISQGANTYYVAVSQGDDEYAIAQKINQATGGTVQGQVVSGKLQLKAATTGAASAFTVSSGGSLASDLGLAETTTGADAAYTVNGTAYSSASNTDATGAIGGVSLDLLATTGSPVTLNVDGAGATTDSLVKNITDFVTAYNAVIDYVNTQTGTTTVTNPTNEQDFLAGPLSDNFSLQNVSYQLQDSTTSPVSGQPAGFQTLWDIGINGGAVTGTYTPSSVTGDLTIDTDQLTTALNTNPDAVKSLLTHLGTGSAQGIVQRIAQQVTQQVTTGTVASNITMAGDQVTDLQKQIQDMQYYLDQKKQYYQTMFSSMETTLSQLNSQGSWLNAIINGQQAPSASSSSSSNSNNTTNDDPTAGS